MANEPKRQVISRWKGKPFVQVVILTPAGKNKKGKQIYHSQTRHEKI